MANGNNKLKKVTISKWGDSFVIRVPMSYMDVWELDKTETKLYDITIKEAEQEGV